MDPLDSLESDEEYAARRTRETKGAKFSKDAQAISFDEEGNVKKPTPKDEKVKKFPVKAMMSAMQKRKKSHCEPDADQMGGPSDQDQDNH